MIVLDIHVAHLERRFAGGEVYLDCVCGNRDRPEQSTFRDPRIEVVNLHVLHGTCEYVKSYEGKGAMVIAAISANEFTAHEAQIGFERKVFGSLSVDSVRARPTDCGPSDEAVGVGNGEGINAR